MKRPAFFTLFLIVILTLSLTACGPRPTPAVAPTETDEPVAQEVVSEPEEPTAVEVTEEGQTGQCDKVYDVHYMQLSPWGRDPVPENIEDNPWKKYILDNFCIDLKIELGPADSPMTKANAMIASGLMPDMFQTYATVADTNVQLWIKSGVLVPLDDYLDKYPKFQNVLYDPDGWKYLQYQGKTYAVATASDENFETLWIRQDWLDNLGLDMPTTIEELEVVAHAFTFDDPDGDGVDNTYAFTAGAREMTTSFGQLFSLFAPFGAYPGNNHIRIEGDEVIFDAFSNEARNALEWWNKMIKAGVVDPDWVTNSFEQFNESIVQGRAGIVTNQFQLTAMYEGGSGVLGKAILDYNPDARWVQVPAIEGPFGKYADWEETPVANAFYLTQAADSEPGKLDAIVRFLSEAMDEHNETYRFMGFGPEGWHYTKDPATNEIIAIDYDNWQNWELLYMNWRKGNEEWWKVAIMGLDEDSFYLWDNYQLAATQPQIPHVTPLVISHDYWPDLQTYIQEMHLKFAVGEQPLTDQTWSTFVETAMTTYRGQEVVDDARNQLVELGVMK